MASLVKSVMDLIRERREQVAEESLKRQQRIKNFKLERKEDIEAAKALLKNKYEEAQSLLLDSRYPHFNNYLESIIKLSREGLANALRKGDKNTVIIEAARYQAIIDILEDIKFYPHNIIERFKKIKG
jgi:hypothetical protein